MKIAILFKNFREGRGGIYSHTLNLGLNLMRKGHEIFIISSRRKDEPQHSETRNMHVYRVPERGLGVLSRGFKYFTYGLNAAKLLRKLQKKFSFDFILGQSVSGIGGTLAKLSIPFIMRNTRPIFDQKRISLREFPKLSYYLTSRHPNRFLVLKHKYLASKLVYDPLIIQEMFSCRKADYNIVLSKSLFREYVSYYKIDPKKTVIIPNGIDIKKYTPFTKKDSNFIKILHVGIDFFKGTHVLLHAITKLVKKYDNVKFFFAGGTGWSKRFKRYAEVMNICDHLSFLGQIPFEEMPKLYTSADIFVHPSLTEGMPFVILEAMASGIPTVATNVGGIPDLIINERTGFLVEPNSSDQIVNKLTILIENAKKRRQMGASARQLSLNFSWLKITERYIKFLKKIH